MCIRGREIHIVLVHGDPSMADVKTLVRRIGVVPQWMCRPGIERPDIVRRRHVQNAIDKDRSGLDLRGLSGFEGPGERKLVDVRRRNLRQPL